MGDISFPVFHVRFSPVLGHVKPFPPRRRLIHGFRAAEVWADRRNRSALGLELVFCNSRAVMLFPRWGVVMRCWAKLGTEHAARKFSVVERGTLELVYSVQDCQWRLRGYLGVKAMVVSAWEGTWSVGLLAHPCSIRRRESQVSAWLAWRLVEANESTL
jgi:hypothetical protein